MTKETYYKAIELLAQINDLEENLMTYFGVEKEAQSTYWLRVRQKSHRGC